MDDLISRRKALDESDRQTVNTNPDDFVGHEKFYGYMKDESISSFGDWQWANGFNTALTAMSISLEELPSALSEPIKITLSDDFNLDDIRKAEYAAYYNPAERIRDHPVQRLCTLDKSLLL